MEDDVVVDTRSLNATEESSGTEDAALDNYETIETFFRETAKISATIPYSKSDLGSLSIFSILRPYQRETVNWMIDRERNQKEVQIGPWNITMPSGGILADEMGLGKTVELLACILGNPKKKEPDDSVTPKSLPLPALSNSPQKRKSISPDVPECLKKKPRLSQIKQNPVLKKEIEYLLHNKFSVFKRRIAKEMKTMSEESRAKYELCFKVTLLSRFFNRLTHSYNKNQVWGYLISEFEVDRVDSVGHLILSKDSSKGDEPVSPANDCPGNDDVEEMWFQIDNYLSDMIMKKFEKEFRLQSSYSLTVARTISIPILEREDMQCRCGSNLVHGEKIRCSKCNQLQHMVCVGYSNDSHPVDHKCPICWMNEPLVESAATLILVPSNLAVQWQNEIIKHAADSNLKVFLYEGVNKNYILPNLMAEYDIVIVSFSTLGKELAFLTNMTRNLRHSKRYYSFVTPLTCINWWRVCIDEAQIVEAMNRVSQMTSHLKHVNSWAVSGTPIGKSLHDLYGLTTFLRMQPFLDSDESWTTLVQKDQTLLHQLFAHLMRRKTKTEVSDQLGLPSLKTDIIWLSFPPIEGYFYKSTHATSKKAFFEKLRTIENIDQPLKNANPFTVSKLLQPLLGLRQACVDPYTVKNMIALFNLPKKSLTMRELLPQMILKSKNEGDDALRLYVMFVNGSAAIHIEKRNFKKAVDMYRQVLNKVKLYEALTSDSFQMIHIMHNLLEAASEDPTIELSDEEKNFPSRIEELEKMTLGKKEELVEAKLQQFNKFKTEIENLLNGIELKTFSWWRTIINHLNFNEILPRIHEALETRHIELTCAWKLKLRTSYHLIESLQYWLSDVTDKRNVIMICLSQIRNFDSLENLWIVAEHCHIRKHELKRSCIICRMESIMLKYEALIFNMGSDERSSNGVHSKPIDWKMSAGECILNVLVSTYRMSFGQNADSIIATKQLQAVELLRKEFKEIRAIWTRQNDLVHVYDEIRMAKSTRDVTTENALENDKHLLEHQLLNFDMKSKVAYQQLQSKYGSLQYLKNLAKKYENSDNFHESCPVCQNAVEEMRAVFICGHFTCYGCTESLVEHSRGVDVIQCPMCRIHMSVTSITHVLGGGTSDCNVSHVEGNFSIKIRAITAKIIDLIREDKDVKILLFSTWHKVLKTMHEALKMNNVSHINNVTPSSLAQFKADKNINVVLLLLCSSSKGLNITEASHIIFVEPALRLADEDQAIGRINRLGQSKNMTVHKFIIKSSVEHQIHLMNENMRGANSNVEITFKHLQNLFDNSMGNKL